MGSVVFSNRQILIDGKAEHIRSGAMHYFRIRPEQWQMRIAALKSCGLNTLETYMPWNLHEKYENSFDFQGGLDIAAYLRAAAEAGLYVILRPGPYICSEWDLGGLPAWLLTKKCRLRSSEKTFMSYAKRYLSEVFKQVCPLLYTGGGPIIAMQIENEYIGNDLKYMEELRDFFLAENIDVPLMASNSPGELTCSLPEGVFASVNGRNHPAAMCETMKKIRPEDPPFVMELWNGSGQYWDDDFICHDAGAVAADIREMMKEKINFNLYMFHGGTSFGFMNGSGGGFGSTPYQDLLTSYDVDSPLPEGGMPGEKYEAIRREILNALPELKLEAPPLPERRAYGEIKLTGAVPFFEAVDMLSCEIPAERALSFEELKCYYGFVLYRFEAENDGVQSISLNGMRDRVQFFVNGKYTGTLHRNDVPGKKLQFKAARGDTLDFLVENCGRLRNTIAELQHESRGLGIVTDNRTGELRNCLCYPLPLDDLRNLEFGKSDGFTTNEPAFYRGYMEVDTPADTFIRVPAGTRGAVWVNGFNLGRYRNSGPQYTLYVPAPLLKKGRNEIIVFELEHLGMNMAWSQAVPDMGRKRDMIL
ncbi:MAG: beta-galactosidase [Lentisphaeria bacterium]|nr:beta-galactosidase [Lentisphaeria bacterium]